MDIGVIIAVITAFCAVLYIQIFLQKKKMQVSMESVLITGASSGLGRAMALQMAPLVTKLYITGRSRERLAVVANECRVLAPNTTVVEIIADLSILSPTDPSGVRALTTAVGDEPLDCLVLNAGISSHDSAATVPLEDTRRVFAVNTFGPIALTQALLPSLEMSPCPRVVVVSSIQGLVPTPRRSAYSASKHALHGFFGALQIEQPRVRVTMACPGWLDTDLRKSSLTSSPGAKPKNSGRAMAPEACAKVIIDGVLKQKRQVIVPGWFRCVVWARMVAPGLLGRAMAVVYGLKK